MRLSNKDKARCHAALDELEKVAHLGFEWTTQWLPVHGGNTSQLEGLKPCSRKDSFANPTPYHVGLANGSFRNLQLPPLVEASFHHDNPTTREVVDALREAVNHA